jgi:prepilin-type N-terminal cleavage/methylation domain-containing protein
MLQKLQKRKENGFTIIEVLIVLAIAGLILLVVFLAVPALQRNSRNTQKKSDVAAILGGISEYVNNSGGGMPANVGAFCDNVKLGYYNADNCADITFTANSGTTVTGVSGRVFVKTGAKCNDAGDNFTATNASGRNVAAVYTVETGGGTQTVCQES